MTVDTDLGRVQYTANGVTSDFVFASRVLDRTHMRVLVGSTVKTLDTDYTVLNVGDPSTTVQFLPGMLPANLAVVTLLRDVPLTQQADYVDNDPFPAQTHEDALDKLTMIEQQQNEVLARSFKFSETLSTSLVGEFTEAPQDGHLLIFDGATGNVKNGPTVDNIADAEANATAALGYKNEAAISAAAAEAAAAGMKWRPSVKVATTGALPTCTYANGTAGIGATLTATSNGALSIDGLTPLGVTNRVLVKDQAAGLQNGVYTVTQAGSAGTPWILTRATDCDTNDEMISQVVSVEQGLTLADFIYICYNNDGITIGTTPILWGGLNIALPDGTLLPAKFASAAYASQAEAEAGVENTKVITALRVKQSIDKNAGKFLQTAISTTSGTTADFTGIPSNAKRITVMFTNVSSNGTSGFAIRLGSASGIETTNYASSGGRVTSAGACSNAIANDKLIVTMSSAATSAMYGAVTLDLLDEATDQWTISGNVADTTNNITFFCAGVKPMNVTPLDRLRVMTLNGTDTFDGGAVSIMWET